jgi:hypothetical protein
MFEKKKAQNLSITTIILIILGIVVLVVLIIGFTQGWDTLKGWFTGGAGTEQYVSQCAVACSTNSVSGWCDDKYNVTGRTGKQSCDDLSKAIAASGDIKASSKKIDLCSPTISC